MRRKQMAECLVCLDDDGTSIRFYFRTLYCLLLIKKCLLFLSHIHTHIFGVIIKSSSADKKLFSSCYFSFFCLFLYGNFFIFFILPQGKSLLLSPLFEFFFMRKIYCFLMKFSRVHFMWQQRKFSNFQDFFSH